MMSPATQQPQKGAIASANALSGAVRGSSLRPVTQAAGSSPGGRTPGATYLPHVRRRHTLQQRQDLCPRSSGALRPPQASASLGATGAPAPLAALRPSQYDDEIWGVALPALATMLLEPIISVINTGLIGHLGTQQLGAVSVASIVVTFAGFVFSFLIFLTTPEIAAAHVKGDKAEVSRIGAKSLWLAVGLGLINTLALLVFGDRIIAAIGPPEPLVRQYASEYLHIRAWGLMMVMVGFVATGTYRGFKDTHTPLWAALGSAMSSLVFTYLFLHVFGWGVKGGAMAVVLAQGVSASVLWGLLLRKNVLRWQDVAQPPSLASLLPMLRKGLVLVVRNIISFGMVLFASTLCVRAGSAYQASFEVIRQIWMLAIQSFECLNVATQALCAAYLGANNRVAAKAILVRVLQLGVMVGAAMGLVVFVLQQPIVGFFSTDSIVVAQVMMTLPMLCMLFPLDAASSIMDGSLLAAKQTDYMSVVQIAGSVVQYFVLITIASNGLVSSFSIWSTLKILTGFRVVGGIARNWFSPNSAYVDVEEQRRPPPTSPSLVPATIAAAIATNGSAPAPGPAAGSAEAAPPSTTTTTMAAAAAPPLVHAATAARAASSPASSTSEPATVSPLGASASHAPPPVSHAPRAEEPSSLLLGASTNHLSASSTISTGSASASTAPASRNSSASNNSSNSSSSSAHNGSPSSSGDAASRRSGDISLSPLPHLPHSSTSSSSIELQEEEESQEAAAEMAEDCMVADCMGGRVMARSAAKDCELVEKRLRCRQHPGESVEGGHLPVPSLEDALMAAAASAGVQGASAGSGVAEQQAQSVPLRG